MPDKYPNFAALARHVAPDRSWRITAMDRPDSNVLIIAPHGGGIERGTSELAGMIAGEDHSLYCFEGLRRRGNGELHITSHHCDEPTALALATRSGIVIGIHGCEGNGAIYVSGLDTVLVTLLADALTNADLPASSEGHDFLAKHRHNICNRSRRNGGAQIEITRDLRAEEFRPLIARVVRVAVLAHQTAIAQGT